MKNPVLKFVWIAVLLGALAGCAAVGEVRDLVKLVSTVEDAVEHGIVPDEGELQALAHRPLPPPPGLVYDLALLRASNAALFLGDIDRVREVRQLAVKHGSNPSIVAGTFGTEGLAEQFAGNFVAALRANQQAMKLKETQATKQAQSPQQKRLLAVDVFNYYVAASQAGDFSAIEMAFARAKKLEADQTMDKYGRAMVQLTAREISAYLTAERDGNYPDAYEQLRSALTTFREVSAGVDSAAEKGTSSPSQQIATRMPILVFYAIGSGRLSSAAIHLDELRTLARSVQQQIGYQLLSQAEMHYQQFVGNDAGALEAFERRGEMMRALESRWLVPRMRTASIRAQHLSGMGRWTEAFDSLKEMPDAMSAPPSLAQDFYIGLRALAAAMVDVDDPSTALILSREQYYKRLRGNVYFQIYFAAKTVIHHRLGMRHRSVDEHGKAVAAGRELAESLRGLQASGARRDAAVPGWLIRLAKESYAASASAALAGGRASYDDLLDAVLLLQMSDMDADVAAAAARKSSIPGVSPAQLRRLQDLQQASRSAQRQITASSQAVDADLQQLARLSLQATKAAEELDRHLAQLRASAPQIAQAWNGSVRLGVTDIQRRLAADEVMVVFAPVGESSTVGMVIAKRGASQAMLAVGKDRLGALVGRLRKSVTFDAAVNVPPFDSAAARELYELLFGWSDRAMAGAKSLTVVAGGSLGSIPFGLLVKPDTKPMGADDYRAMPWLIRSLAVSHQPSVTAWHAVTSAHSTAKVSGFFAWADPDFAGRSAPVASATRGVRGSLRSTLPAEATSVGQLPPNLGDLLPPLPETKDEAQAIAQALGGSQRDVVVGAAATRSSVLKESESGALARRNVVMFATHGLMPAQVQGLDQPALAMAQEPGTTMPSLLKLDDVMALRLDADWVLLSACSTASADSVGGDPLSGLARGFFFAGARSLLVTHWAVESESAAAITTRTIERFVRNSRLTRAQALQQAAMELIDGRNAPAEWAHPAFWAPYALVGNGGRGGSGR